MDVSSSYMWEETVVVVDEVVSFVEADVVHISGTVLEEASDEVFTASIGIPMGERIHAH